MAKKILLVEGVDEIADLIKEVLDEDFGHEVTKFSNGPEGLEEALKNPYDLIFFDHHMPLLGGREFIDQVRGKEGPNQHTPAVFIIGIPDPDQLKIQDYEKTFQLNKPVQTNDLEEIIEKTLQ